MNAGNIGGEPLFALGRKAKRISTILTVIGIISLTGLIFIGGLCFSALMEETNRKKIEKRDAIHVETLHNQKGFPATLEDLQEGTVYAVSVSMMNIQNGTTNYFAVLREVKVVTDSEYRYKEPRFFKLPFSLDGNRYYQFFRSGTGKIARAEEYPPPTPR